MSDDLIRRSDAIKAVRHISMEFVDADTRQKLIEAIPAIPTIRPKRPEACWSCNCEKINPKCGEWIVDQEQGTSTCSNCGIVWQFTDGTNGSNFCPNCGADMRERESE